MTGTGRALPTSKLQQPCFGVSVDAGQSPATGGPRDPSALRTRGAMATALPGAGATRPWHGLPDPFILPWLCRQQRPSHQVDGARIPVHCWEPKTQEGLLVPQPRPASQPVSRRVPPRTTPSRGPAPLTSQDISVLRSVLATLLCGDTGPLHMEEVPPSILRLGTKPCPMSYPGPGDKAAEVRGRRVSTRGQPASPGQSPAVSGRSHLGASLHPGMEVPVVWAVHWLSILLCPVGPGGTQKGSRGRPVGRQGVF